MDRCFYSGGTCISTIATKSNSGMDPKKSTSEIGNRKYE